MACAAIFARYCTALAVCVILLCTVRCRVLYSSDSSDSSADESSANDESSSRVKVDPTSDGFDSSGDNKPRNCDGRGVQYCDSTQYAVSVTECPEVCLKCESSSETDKLKRLSKNKMYDFVYVESYGICLANCKDRHRSSCGDFSVYRGTKYCKYLRCSSGGIDGCHSRSDFGEPSCRDCATVFPNACNRDISESVDIDSSEASPDFWKRFVAYQRNYSYYNSTNTVKPVNITGALMVRVISGNETINQTVIAP